MMTSLKGGGGGGGGPGGQPNYMFSSGDWPCPRLVQCVIIMTSSTIMSSFSCGNMNFARRTECNRCQEPRPMGRDLVTPDNISYIIG